MCVCAHSPVSRGWDEVYAAVHSGVWDPLLPVDVDFLLQVALILVVDELHDGLPAEREGGKKGGRDLKRERWICSSFSFV